MKSFKEQQLNENADLKKALKKVKGLTQKQISVLMTIPTPALNAMINQLGMLVAQREIEEKLVASDIGILDTILKKVRDDIIKDKLGKRFERSWPKMIALAKMAGYGISKKMQQKGKTYLWVLKK